MRFLRGIIYLAILGIGGSLNAHSSGPFNEIINKGESDYSVDLHFQSYPINGFVEGSLGYALPFWQGKHYENLYGYVRPYLNYSTSLLVNSMYLGVEIFPVPFLGVYGGIGGTKSFQDEYQGEDCRQISCKGRYSERFLGVKGGGSYSSFFLTFDYYSERMRHSDHKQAFIEHRTGLKALSQGDSLTHIEWVLGFTTFEKYSFGILNTISKTRKSKQHQDALYLMVSKQWSYYTGTFLVGNHRDHYKKNHLAFIFNLNWIGKRGLGFF